MLKLVLIALQTIIYITDNVLVHVLHKDILLKILQCDAKIVTLIVKLALDLGLKIAFPALIIIN